MTQIRTCLCFLLLTFSGLASAQQEIELPAEDDLAIKETIAAQVQAFRDGDLEAAYSYASPGIQARFGDPAVFGAMVEAGYGQIFSAYAYEFEAMIGSQDQPIQVLIFTGSDLTSVLAFYLMEKQPDGTWRINGVRVQPIASQAA